MKHEVLGLLLKLWLICVIGFILFCIGRGFNHFPKKVKYDGYDYVVTLDGQEEYVEKYAAVPTSRVLDCSRDVGYMAELYDIEVECNIINSPAEIGLPGKQKGGEK